MSDTARLAHKDGSGLEQHEYFHPASPAPTKGQKIKRHCRRCWWVHLLISIIITVVVLLLVIFVGYPKIAQGNVDKSKTVVTSQQLSNPTPSSVDLNLTAVLLSDSAFHPQLDSWNASLYLDGSDTPFTYLQVPAAKAVNGTQIHIQQTAQIANMDQFINFSLTTFASDNFTFYLKGDGGLKQGSLQKTSVHYNEATTLMGFQGLQSVTVTEFELQLNKKGLPFNSNSQGKVAITNPSDNTIDLGNVTLALSVAGTAIGNATIPDFVLSPGNQTYTLYSTSDQVAVAGLLAKPAYRCGVLPVDIKGNESTYNGQVIPYFTESLKATTQHTTLDISSALKDAGLGSLLTGSCQT